MRIPMTEMAEHRPDVPLTESLTPPTHPRLESALDGMSMLLRLAPAEAAALRNHFRPVPADNRSDPIVLNKVNSLLAQYFDSRYHTLTGRFFEPSGQRRQKQLRMQRALARRLLGDRANAVSPMRMQTLLRGHSDVADAIIEDLEDLLIETVMYHARYHHFDHHVLLGDVAENAHEDVFKPAFEPQMLPETQLDQRSDEPAQQDAAHDDDTDTHELAVHIEPAAEDAPPTRTRQRRIKWGNFVSKAIEIDPLDDEGPALLAPPDDRHSQYLSAERIKTKLTRDDIELLSARIATGGEAARRIEAGNYHEEELDNLTALAQDGAKARRVLAAHNLGLVVDFVRRHPNFYVERDDAIQTGNVALVEMLDGFDPFYKTQEGETTEFSTLALTAIKNRVFYFYGKERRQRSIARAANLDDVRLLERSYQEARRTNPDITYEEVGEWLGFRPQLVAFLREGKGVQRLLSLDQHYGIHDDGDGQELIGLVSDLWSQGEFAHVDNELAGVRFWEYLESVLAPSDFQALYMYYVHGYTQEKIAKEMDVGRSRVTQYIDRGHKRIRAAVEGRDPRERRSRGKSKRKDGVRAFFRKLGVPVADDADPQQLRDRLTQILEELNLGLTEGAIMRLRYGLGSEGDLELSQQETAQKLELSRGYVSKVDPDIIRRARVHLGLVQPDSEESAA